MEGKNIFHITCAKPVKKAGTFPLKKIIKGFMSSCLASKLPDQPINF
jgi:hypothetical protein